MKQITAKELNEHLKHGWTTARFAERHQCTEDEFIRALEKAFPGKAGRELKNRLEKNDERAQKKEKRTEISKNEAIAENAQECEVTLMVETEKMFPSENEEGFEEETMAETAEPEHEDAEEEKETMAEKITTLLKELDRKEHETRSKICDMEAERVRLSNAKQKLKDDVQRQSMELAKIRQTAEKLAEEFERTVKKMSEIDESAASLNDELAFECELLHEIQEEIKELKKINIFVYASGQVEVEGAIEFYETSNWFKTFREISNDEQFENLTVKQLKLLAKIITFVSDVKTEYTVTFEEELLQEAFKVLQGA